MTFNIVHQNIQGIRNKIIELELFLNETSCDVFCVSEHWAKNDQVISLNIEGYMNVAYYCRNAHIHGGVCMYVRNGIRYSELNFVNDMSVEKHFECTGVKVSINGNKFIILTTYRSPEGDFALFISKLGDLLHEVYKKYKHHNYIVCGDFNINFSKRSNNLHSLLDTFDSYSMYPTIQAPTRGSNCIDNIFINIESSGFKTEVLDNTLGDHLAQILKLSSLNNEENNSDQFPYQYRDIHNQDNINYFLSLLENEKWIEIYELNGDVNGAFNTFHQIFQYYFELAFPIKTRVIKSKKDLKKPWLTRGIRISGEKLKNLHKLSSENEVFKDYYKRYKKVYSKVIKDAKRLYNSDKLLNAKNKSKAAWGIIKQNKTKIIENYKLNVDNDVITDPKAVANNFIQYFNNIPNILTKNKPQHLQITLKENNPISFYFQPATEHEIIDIIKHLKNSNSYGDDNISTNIVKICSKLIAKPLTYLVNCSLEQGVFPECLKIAKIKPLHKSGCKNNIENFRPISLLNSFSKIFEKYAANKVINFFEKYNLLNKNQFGFRKGISTNDAIITFLNTLYSKMDKGEKTLSIFLDLSKAFDTVEHNMLV